jgi:hypothetical protein
MIMDCGTQFLKKKYLNNTQTMNFLVALMIGKSPQDIIFILEEI